MSRPVNKDDLLEVLQRYETALYEIHQGGDDSEPATKELADARADLMVLLKRAKGLLENAARFEAPPVPAIDMPAYRAAMASKFKEHRVSEMPEQRQKELCAACRALGSTFACTTCNQGATKVKW